MRKGLVLLVLATSLFLPSAAVHAIAGTKCSVIGAQRNVGKVTFTCTRSGKSRIWKASATSKKVAPSTTTPISSTLDSLKVPMTVGALRAGDGAGNGPWAVRAVLRTSTDGVTFTGEETIMDQAGVPNLLSTSSGALYAYYQDWANGNIMGVAVRRSGSSSWDRYKVSISGINTAPGGANGVDPSAVELSDGRIRLFWMQRLNGNRIYSATSSIGAGNGIVFTYDGGFAFETSTEIFDPTVVQTATGWALWASVPAGTAYATSTNGLNFSAQPSNSAFPTNAVFPWGATRLPSGEIRVIASLLGPGGRDGVLYRSTDGGTTFSEVSRGAVPSNAGGDVGISYNAVTGMWYQLLSVRM